MKKIPLFLVSLVCERWTNSRRAVSVRDNQAFCRPAKRNELTSRTAIIAAKKRGKRENAVVSQRGSIKSRRDLQVKWRGKGWNDEISDATVVDGARNPHTKDG